MTKEDIIKAVWNELPDLTVKEAQKVYEATMSLIRDTLAQGDTIEIRNFGKFTVKEKTPRVGRNPRTGEEAVIKERRIVTFKPSKNFRNQVLDAHNLNDGESSE
jgi:nucleoid DNA-binding protein